MKAIYDLTLIGCCDSTSIKVELTPEQYKLLQEIGKLTETAASNRVQPFLTIDKDGE